MVELNPVYDPYQLTIFNYQPITMISLPTWEYSSKENNSENKIYEYG
jgi:hypothetical protein